MALSSSPPAVVAADHRTLAGRKHGRTLILFDVDGTLAVPAQKAPDEIVAMLAQLRREHAVGIVGAGDFEKQQGQLGGPGLRERLDFVFSENGVHAFSMRRFSAEKGAGERGAKARAGRAAACTGCGAATDHSFVPQQPPKVPSSTMESAFND